MHKLYLCPVAKLTQYLPIIFKFLHPCIRAKSAFDKNKLDYEIHWVPFFRKFRKSVIQISQQSSVPVWQKENGEVIADSSKILSIIKKGARMCPEEN